MPLPILDAPISPLRQRLIDDMNMRRFSGETQRNYLRDIGRLATFLGRSPDTATTDDLRRFQIEQQDDGVPVPTMNSIVSALRFFFTHTVDRPDLARKLVRLAQPCDLMVRSNGKRVREENFKVAVLAPLRTRPLGDEAGAKDGLNFSLEHYDHSGAQSAIVLLADATPANLQVLDLAVFNKDGRCQLAAAPDPAMNLPSQAWERRDAELRNHFGKVTKQIEAARRAHKDPVADLLATAIIPRGAPKKAFAKFGAYDSGAFSYPIRRRGRIRDPLAASLLMAYSRFLARDAYEHDFSKAE
ncbi:site-specific integrase [Rhizobiaceae sp. 2RAB30]